MQRAKQMLSVSAPWLFSAAAAAAGVGYTLLRYSRDGDLSLRAKPSRFAEPAQTTEEEAWQRLSVLANASATEVTWNTSLFVAIVSSFVFLGLLAMARGGHLAPLPPALTGVMWTLSVLTVFGLQDAVFRWKSAHRKHAAAAEQNRIIERLRWMQAAHAARDMIKRI